MLLSFPCWWFDAISIDMIVISFGSPLHFDRSVDFGSPWLQYSLAASILFIYWTLSFTLSHCGSAFISINSFALITFWFGSCTVLCTDPCTLNGTVLWAFLSKWLTMTTQKYPRYEYNYLHILAGWLATRLSELNLSIQIEAWKRRRFVLFTATTSSSPRLLREMPSCWTEKWMDTSIDVT